MSPKVLVVDDEADLRWFLRLELERAGYEVVEAGDGSAALAAIAADHPDVMLLDLKMPVLDGFAVLEQLAEDRRRGVVGADDGTKVIVLTALGTDTVFRQVRHLGAVGALRKPFRSSEVLDLVKSVL